MLTQTLDGKKPPRLHHRSLGLLSIYGLLLSITLSAGAASFADVLAAEKKAVEQGVSTQKQIESIDDRHARLVGQYRSAVKQQEDLVKYNKQLRSVVESQEREARSFEEQLQRVGHLERDIVPLMSDMLDTLEEFVALDAPFLRDERQARVGKLRELFASASVSNSEKYRRILEAYQIENDYGRTIEAYDAPLRNEETGGEQLVTFLKVGRAIFLYQSLDGSESFHWHQDRRQWIPLPNHFNQQISRGIKMAREQTPSDLLLLPVVMPKP